MRLQELQLHGPLLQWVNVVACRWSKLTPHRPTNSTQAEVVTLLLGSTSSKLCGLLCTARRQKFCAAPV
jgi:hypothetical protein